MEDERFNYLESLALGNGANLLYVLKFYEDLIKERNSLIADADNITDACVILGMPIDGDPVDFLTSFDSPAMTFQDCTFNIISGV